MLGRLVTHRFVSGTKYSGTVWQSLFQQVARGKISFDECLKHDGTTTVYVATFNHKRFVVKRFNTKNTWHFIRRLVQTSRAANCFKMAGLYLDAGIKTPEPIAFVQEYIGVFKLGSWYICRFEEGVLLSSYLEEGAVIPMHIDHAISSLFGQMASARLSHGDMKATNLIVNNNSVCLIDLDAARYYQKKAPWLKAITKDWNRLLKNWRSNTVLYQSFYKLKVQYFSQYE